MSALIVCPLSQVDALVRSSGARRLVTLMGSQYAVPHPPGIDDHLVIEVGDIVEARDGHVLPDTEHVVRLLAFATAWDRTSPMLIHCWAGVSRSTAAALIVACALDPARDEATLASALREASPTATPNARLIALADGLLARSGRLVAAAAAIGRGAECFEGVPFSFPVGR